MARKPVGSDLLLCAAAVLLALFDSGCASNPAAPYTAHLSQMTAEQAKCKVAASQSSPLVTEWPASEKANLEALIPSGGVAVAYAGCSLRVLPECRVNGQYHWQRTTPATDVIEIKNSDDLYAKLPIGAVSLESELQRSGSLSIRTTVSGQMKLGGAPMHELAVDPACYQATDVVAAVSVGAFSLSAGDAWKGKAGVSVTALGVGAGTDRSAQLLRSAGDPDSCGTGTAESPAPNCASPVQVFLWPIPGRVAEEGPPGTTKVDLVSGNASTRWDVYHDDQVICTTPCSTWIDPSHPLLFRARDEGWGAPADRVEVGSLLPYDRGGPLQVQAHATERGKLVTGITFTALSGMATVAGIALTAIGCSNDDLDGMCTAGLITGVAGGAVLAGSIWLILDSRARAEVIPLDGSGGPMMMSRPEPAGIRVGPGAVFGRF